jgi:hypothetical protein
MPARVTAHGTLRVLLTPMHNGSAMYGAAVVLTKFGAGIGDFVILCSVDETVGGVIAERGRYGLVVDLKSSLAASEVTVIRTALGAVATTKPEPGAGT